MSLWREYDAERCKQGSQDAIMLVSFDLKSNVRIQFDNVRIAGPDDAEDPCVMCGTIDIFGVMHHAMFFRVVDRDGEQVLDSKDLDEEFCDEFDGLYALSCGPMNETVELPGFSGKWLIGIHPSD
jgi:hypothetical protein